MLFELRDLSEGPQTPSVANLDYTKGKYRQQQEEALRTGVCPFCKPEFQNDPKYPVLRREGRWYIRRRIKHKDYPAKDRRGWFPKEYLLIVKDDHGEEMTDQDFVDFGRLWRWAVKEFDIPGGGIGWRFGDSLSGRTIVHQHVHLVQPNLRRINPDGSSKAWPFDWPMG